MVLVDLMLSGLKGPSKGSERVLWLDVFGSCSGDTITCDLTGQVFLLLEMKVILGGQE